LALIFSDDAMNFQGLEQALVFIVCKETPNGLRYRRLRRINSRNGKLLSFRTSPKNAQSPSRPVHALLGCFYACQDMQLSNITESE
jgi:hypothetical protein